jgi:hypothetical protein
MVIMTMNTMIKKVKVLLSLTRNRNSVMVKRRDFEDKIRHDLCPLNITGK